jgi:ankyrin repeat protein
MPDTMPQLELHKEASPEKIVPHAMPQLVLQKEVSKQRRRMEQKREEELLEQRKKEAERQNQVRPRVRAYVNARSYPVLPRGYRWKEQKAKYCPPDLLNRPLAHKFGYVFCHRGLYDRARHIIDNSETAVINGIKQKMYLHEIDTFILGRVDHAIVAHDMVSGRVTAEDKLWSDMPLATTLKTFLVSKAVNLKKKKFAQEYHNTDDRVPALMGAIWKELLEPTGVTLHIDIRDHDFAKIFPFYSYHITKGGYQSNSIGRQLFRSTMLKGYNYFYPSFAKLEEEIKKNCESLYGQNYYKRAHLHQFPRLIMVFAAKPLRELAEKTWDSSKGSDRRPSYKHLCDTVYEQVNSFVGIGPARYNFILEICHSGLGLGYDLQTRKASNPLNGDRIKSEEVKYESRLDRAMIDVSLRIREENKKYVNKVLFSSCTRLPDVVAPNGARYKVRFQTANVEKWSSGEEGISNELRSIHGGLYPQSDIVVADDPLAEIAARTWIDQRLGLDRSKLKNDMTYNEWLKKGGENLLEETGEDVVKAMGAINSVFMANRVGNLVVQSDGTESRNATPFGLDAESLIVNYPGFLDAEQEEEEYDESERSLANPVTALKDWRLFSPEQKKNVDKSSARVAVTDPSGYTRIYEGGPSDKHRIYTIGEAVFEFDNVENGLRASNSLNIYQKAYKGQLDKDYLMRMLQYGADINALTGLYGTPLAAACGRLHWSTTRLLVKDGSALVCVKGPFGFPLEIVAAKGDQEFVNLLLKHTRRQKSLRNEKLTAESLQAGFHAACRHGFIVIVCMILDGFKAITGKEMPINYEDERHGNALQVTCLRGHLEVVKLLLDKGADMSKETGHFGTPLSAACIQGHEEIVRELTRRDMEFATETHNTSPLYWACMYGHEGIARHLLACTKLDKDALGDVQGATTNELKHRGRELLNQMLTTHMRPVISGGHQAGVIQQILRKETRSVLGAASAGGYGRIVRVLLRYGADVNLRVGDGGSALYWACANGHLSIARLLLKHKAMIDNHATLASSALYGAYVGGHLDNFILLLKHNARFELPTGTTVSRNIEDWLDTPEGRRYKGHRLWSDSKIMSHPAGLGSRKPQGPLSPDPSLKDDDYDAWTMAGHSVGPKLRDCGGEYATCPICTLDQYMADARPKAPKPVSRRDSSPSEDEGPDPGSSGREKAPTPLPHSGRHGATRDIELTDITRSAQSRHSAEGSQVHYEHAVRDSRRREEHPRSFPLISKQRTVPPENFQQQTSQDVRSTHRYTKADSRTVQTARTGLSPQQRQQQQQQQQQQYQQEYQQYSHQEIPGGSVNTGPASTHKQHDVDSSSSPPQSPPATHARHEDRNNVPRQQDQYQDQHDMGPEGRYGNSEQIRANPVNRSGLRPQNECLAHAQHQARQEPRTNRQQVHLSAQAHPETGQRPGPVQGDSINNTHQHRVSPPAQSLQQTSTNNMDQHHQYTSSPQMTYDCERPFRGQPHQAPVGTSGENQNRSRAGYVAAGAAGGATVGVAATTSVTQDAGQEDDSECCC